jgi:hypothetical protein
VRAPVAQGRPPVEIANGDSTGYTAADDT